MAGGDRELVLLDASVLINFLNVHRLDLLSEHPCFRFIVTNHVMHEITNADQTSTLHAAIQASAVLETEVSSTEEVTIFGDLVQTSILGPGECAALAAAIHRKLRVAIDDKAARSKAKALFGFTSFLGTADLVVELLKEGMLTVSDADAMKLSWEATYRFRLPFKSFAEVVGGT